MTVERSRFGPVASRAIRQVLIDELRRRRRQRRGGAMEPVTLGAAAVERPRDARMLEPRQALETSVRSALRVVVGHVLRHEHDRTLRADEEQCRRHAPEVAHGIICVVLGLREQVVERLELPGHLHRRHDVAGAAVL